MDTKPIRDLITSAILLADHCAPLSRLTAGNDESWEQAVRSIRQDIAAAERALAIYEAPALTLNNLRVLLQKPAEEGGLLCDAEIEALRLADELSEMAIEHAHAYRKVRGLDLDKETAHPSGNPADK